MATEKLKYNKTALKAQRDALAKYEKFLPILQLKKMQLEAVLRQLDPVIQARQSDLRAMGDGCRTWARLLTDRAVDIRDFVELQETRTDTDNIAGVEVPEFREAVFREAPYSLFATPLWLDVVVQALRSLVSLREQIRVLKTKEALIREELRVTTQRCNLFEKKLMPEHEENIHRIRIFLGDRETEAVGRAKIAKAKTSELGAS
jgi:V/A-type H+/Na+-transporting ATPase subunit D